MSNKSELNRMTLSEIEDLTRKCVQQAEQSDDDLSDVQKQLHEINASIARLESQGVTVPEALRETKLELHSRMSKANRANESLAEIRDRLLEIVNMIPAPDGSTVEIKTSQDALHYPKLQIEIPQRQVIVEEEQVHLTPKEFGLLVHLASRPGVVCTREELLDAVWDKSRAESSVRTVDTHIKRLRQKIEEERDVPWSLATVWGTGYKFAIE